MSATAASSRSRSSCRCVNFVFTIWLGILPGTPGPNQYGDVPDICPGVTMTSEPPAIFWSSWCARRRVTPAAGAGARCAGAPSGAGGLFRRPAGLRGAGSEPVENLFAAIGQRRAASDACRPCRRRAARPGGNAGDIRPSRRRSSTACSTAAARSDMKGGLAAMVAAALRFVGAARRGFRRAAVVPGDRRRGGRRRSTAPRSCSNGRRRGASASPPRSSASRPARAELGDQIKIGRRGSFSATLVVEGKQGHAAYPEQADNPVRGLTQLLHALQAEPLDAGSEHFGPSSLEVVSVDVGNPAWNVIPATATRALQQPLQRLLDARDACSAEIERRLAGAAADAGAWRADSGPLAARRRSRRRRMCS